jgi:transglutaminase-like putative cysteine protease
LAGAGATLAQPGPPANEVETPTNQRWKIGIVVRAVGGPCRSISGTVPVPTNWPEQTVRIVDEEISPSVRNVRYRTIDFGVKQMVIEIPNLAAGETASALVTFEIQRRMVPEPEAPLSLRIPERLPPDIRRHLSPSPYIESRHPKIRDLAKELKDESLAAWKQVEKIFDYVRDHVEYKNGKLKGALAALRDGDGDCEELTSLFIALCRANKIPARTVWIPGHCYPEFYLVDENQQGRWFPCQVAGTRTFGSMPDPRPILQKGDNFRVPGRRERQRYVAEFIKGYPLRSGGKPEIQVVRQRVVPQ